MRFNNNRFGFYTFRDIFFNGGISIGIIWNYKIHKIIL